jgi:hypothetical protein
VCKETFPPFLRFDYALIPEGQEETVPRDALNATIQAAFLNGSNPRSMMYHTSACPTQDDWTRFHPSNCREPALVPWISWAKERRHYNVSDPAFPIHSPSDAEGGDNDPLYALLDSISTVTDAERRQTFRLADALARWLLNARDLTFAHWWIAFQKSVVQLPSMIQVTSLNP